MIVLIVAMTKDRVIGKDNSLPWNIPQDLQIFKRLTTGHPIIMGRSTYESIGRPLPNRTNIVLSNTMKPQEKIVVCSSLQEAIDTAKTHNDNVFIIGGASVYEKALPFVDKLCVSWVKKECDGDTYFPKIDWNKFQEVHSEDYKQFIYKEYVRTSKHA